MKTTMPPTDVCVQDEEMAKRWFTLQAGEIRRREALEKMYSGARRELWRHRRAVTGTGVAVLVGLLIGVQLPFATAPVDFDHVFDRAYAVLPFLCWLPNLVFAEWLLRRRGLPALHLSPSRTAPSGSRP